MAEPGTGTRASPEELLERFRAGGRPGDLAALFDATAPELFRLALHLCPDAATAEDCLQETFLAVLLRASSYEPGRPALPWLTGILRNEALMARHRAARRPDPRRVAPPRPPDDPGALAETAEEREALHAALQRLPEPYRGVALLRWRYGLEPAQIADVKGVPPGTVWSWLHRALARLKVEMGALPALLLAFRPERGMEGVRRALLRRSGAQAAASVAGGATAASVATMGGFLMANKALAVGAAILVLGGAGWLAFRPVTVPGPAPSSGPAVASSRPPSPVPPPKLPPSRPAAAEEAQEALPDPVDLSKCDRDLDLFGVVVDGQDLPVAGAVLQVEYYPWQAVHGMNSAHYYDMVPGPGTRSGVDGTFRLRLRRGESVNLRVRKEGLAERFLSQCLAGERLRVVLARGADLVVQVLDEDGAPAKDARLRLWRNLPTYGKEIERTGTTDEKGSFVFDALTPGRALLSVEHESHALPNWAQPEIKAQETVTVEVRLPAARIVEGTVKDAATGAPVPGARVGIGWTMKCAVTTGADGTYRMEQWAPKQGRSDLSARAEGYVGLGIEVPEVGGVDFALRPGDAVTGRLVDASGDAVAEALVSVDSIQPSGPPSPALPMPIDYLSGPAGEDGRFLLRGLVHGTAYHRLTATADGHGRLLLEFPPAPEEGGTTDLGDLPFPPARAIEGVVLDLEGKPAGGVGVKAQGGFPERGRRMPGGNPLGPELGRGSMDLRRTDDLGRFRFTDLAPGPWTVTARLEGLPPLSKDVVLPSDQDLTGIVLGGSDPKAATLAVRIVDERDRPMEGLLVSLQRMSTGGPGLRLETDASGSAVFRGLRRKEACQLMVMLDEARRGFVQPFNLPISVDGQEVRVVLREAAEIRGEVFTARGEAIEGLTVQACDSDAEASARPIGAAWTDASGAFTMKVPRGAPMDLEVPGYRIVRSDDPGRARAQELTPWRGSAKGVVAPVEGIRINLVEAKSDRTLIVEVLDPDGRPVPFIVVHLQGADLRDVATGPDGRAKFEFLKPGPNIVMLQLPEGFSLPEDLLPPAAAQVPVDGGTITMRLTRGAVLAGRVLLPDGNPAAGAHVYAMVLSKSLISFSVKTDAAGRFRLGVMPGEEHFVSASLFRPDNSVLLGHIEAVVPGPDPVEIRLAPKQKN